MKMSGMCTDDGKCGGSPEASPNEINGQKSQDWVPEPGGVVLQRPQPPSDANLDRGPCENQSAGGSLLGGGTGTGGTGVCRKMSNWSVPYTRKPEINRNAKQPLRQRAWATCRLREMA